MELQLLKSIDNYTNQRKIKISSKIIIDKITLSRYQAFRYNKYVVHSNIMYFITLGINNVKSNKFR